MVGIVQVCNSNPQWLDTCRRAILSPSDGNIDSLWAVKTALDIIDLGGTLAKVCPVIESILKAMLVGSLCTPDYTCTGSAWVESGMGTVSFVSVSKLAVNF